MTRMMQQFTFVKGGHLEWREAPTPRITGGAEALVQPLAVARCDLDLYIANGSYPLPGPFAFGHEIAGTVLEVGEDVTSVAPGDRVIVPFQINCGSCSECQLGFTNACSKVPPFSAYGLAPSSGKDWGGGLSDLLHVPFADAMLVAIPPDTSLPVAAALSDNVSDGYRAVAGPLKHRPSEPVLVVGGLAQSVGLFAVAFARALGAERVVYLDNDKERMALAGALGAEVHCSNDQELSSSLQFPVVVDASATVNGLNTAVRATAAAGFCTSVSNPIDGSADLPLRSMYMKGITYELSRVHARCQLPSALACIQTGRVDPASIVTRLATFDDAAEAICEPAIKMVFVRDQSEGEIGSTVVGS